MSCLMLGTMLHLGIQKGKEDMKASTFQKYLRGTTTCMNRISIATKGCGQLISNETYFCDIWFSSVKTAKEMMSTGFYYCGPVKTSHKGFCLATLETFDEILAGRVISCYEEYSKSYW